MDRYDAHERDDILLSESPSGLFGLASSSATADIPPVGPLPPVLYVVSLFGVQNQRGERIDGDALIVRAPNQPDPVVLAAVLGCSEAELPAILARGGTWAVRQITAIDGHRLHFEPN